MTEPCRIGPPSERFHRNYLVSDTGCWMWQGAVAKNGYGHIYAGGKHVRVHRFSYELHHGTIPAGMVVDHMCRMRMCVNPEHLQAVSRKENNENRDSAGRNSSGHRGVYWDKVNNMWEVRVTHNYKQHWGGRHEALDVAVEVATRLRNKLFTNNLEDRLTA